MKVDVNIVKIVVGQNVNNLFKRNIIILIEAYPEYIIGHIKSGHYECNIPDDKYVEIKNNRSALINYIRVNGDLLVDDWEIDDIGSIESIHTFN